MAVLRLISRRAGRPRGRHRVAVRGRAAGRAAVRAVRSPVTEFVFAVGLSLFGASLIALWAVGMFVVMLGLFLVTDAALRDGWPTRKKVEKPAAQSRHEEILEQWRKAR